MWRIAGFAGLLLLAGCSVPREFSTRVKSPDFVRESAMLLVESEIGWSSVLLDGSSNRSVFPTGLKILDIGPDGRTVVLTNRKTDLLLGNVETGELRAVPELAGRVGSAAISPDGKLVAVVRHADYALPGGRGVDDDGVFLVDAQSLRVSGVPSQSNTLVTRIAWAQSGDSLWLVMSEGWPQVVTLADNTRHEHKRFDPPFVLREPPTRATSKCPATGATLDAQPTDATLWLNKPGTPKKALVKLGNGEKWVREVDLDYTNVMFSPTCSYAVFVFQQRVWVVEVATGKLTDLAPGYRAFFAPR